MGEREKEKGGREGERGKEKEGTFRRERERKREKKGERDGIVEGRVSRDDKKHGE